MKELFDFIILFILYIFIFFKKWQAKGKDVLVINTLMYIYLSFVLYFTLMPIFTSLPNIFIFTSRTINLTPFIDVIESKGDFIRQVVLNVVMTIPFGFLLPHIRNLKINFIKTIFYTFSLSLIIEILQPIINSYRSTDITDLITNTLGGVIGYVFYLIFKPLTNKILNFIKD